MLSLGKAQIRLNTPKPIVWRYTVKKPKVKHQMANPLMSKCGVYRKTTGQWLSEPKKLAKLPECGNCEKASL